MGLWDMAIGPASRKRGENHSMGEVEVPHAIRGEQRDGRSLLVLTLDGACGTHERERDRDRERERELEEMCADSVGAA